MLNYMTFSHRHRLFFRCITQRDDSLSVSQRYLTDDEVTGGQLAAPAQSEAAEEVSMSGE